MSTTKADIVRHLRKEILSLQGFKTSSIPDTDITLGAIQHAFPGEVFPSGAVHEFICNSIENVSATAGFIAALIAVLMRNNGACIWIDSSQTIYPPALKLFGIEPDKIIFIHLKKEKEILWVMEEALKCDGLTAVVGELKEPAFPITRRLQLAVEKSKVTGFILRCNPVQLAATACVARWRISFLPGIPGEVPGVGFPSWNVEILKMRNGKTGAWEIMWMNGAFHPVYTPAAIMPVVQKKTG